MENVDSTVLDEAELESKALALYEKDPEAVKRVLLRLESLFAKTRIIAAVERHSLAQFQDDSDEGTPC